MRRVAWQHLRHGAHRRREDELSQAQERDLRHRPNDAWGVGAAEVEQVDLQLHDLETLAKRRTACDADARHRRRRRVGVKLGGARLRLLRTVDEAVAKLVEVQPLGSFDELLHGLRRAIVLRDLVTAVDRRLVERAECPAELGRVATRYDTEDVVEKLLVLAAQLEEADTRNVANPQPCCT